MNTGLLEDATDTFPSPRGSRTVRPLTFDPTGAIKDKTLNTFEVARSSGHTATTHDFVPTACCIAFLSSIAIDVSKGCVTGSL